MIYVVTYRSQFDGYPVAAFYDEEIARDYARQHGRGYIVECFMGAKKIY